MNKLKAHKLKHHHNGTMPSVQTDVFDKATVVAAKSTMQHQHGAIIIRGNNIISTGYNHLTTFMCHQWSVHAEVDALMNIPKKYKQNKAFLQECIMIVVRIGPPSKPDCKYSKPCDKCKEAIHKYGIKKVFYST